ncbi:acyl-CoA thioesterase [Rickettsiales bacterium LUAb2]
MGNSNNDQEKGELAIRVLTMPTDVNLNGNIFGGWIFSQMDLAGAVVASKLTKSKLVSIAVNNMKFIKPILLGDVVSIYVNFIKKGNTSITYQINVYSNNRCHEDMELAVVAEFVYVKIDDSGKACSI